MKQIMARAGYCGMYVHEVTISDHDAMMATLQRSWTGFSKEEALRSANAKLNQFGYEAILEEQD